MKLIGIAGGSGSGKSTLAIALCRKYPEKFALVHIDDYFKPKEVVQLRHGFTNWDHPSAIRFDDLYRDLVSLKQGKIVTIRTKSELYNPDYKPELRNKIDYDIKPQQAIILEGYLALRNESIRELLDFTIYLDLPIKESLKRRSDNKSKVLDEYFDEVLIPMYERFALPTKQYADLVIDVSQLDAAQTLAVAEPKILTVIKD